MIKQPSRDKLAARGEETKRESGGDLISWMKVGNVGVGGEEIVLVTFPVPWTECSVC